MNIPPPLLASIVVYLLLLLLLLLQPTRPPITLGQSLSNPTSSSSSSSAVAFQRYLFSLAPIFSPPGRRPPAAPSPPLPPPPPPPPAPPFYFLLVPSLHSYLHQFSFFSFCASAPRFVPPPGPFTWAPTWPNAHPSAPPPPLPVSAAWGANGRRTRACHRPYLFSTRWDVSSFGCECFSAAVVCFPSVDILHASRLWASYRRLTYASGPSRLGVQHEWLRIRVGVASLRLVIGECLRLSAPVLCDSLNSSHTFQCQSRITMEFLAVLPADTSCGWALGRIQGITVFFHFSCLVYGARSILERVESRTWWLD